MNAYNNISYHTKTIYQTNPTIDSIESASVVVSDQTKRMTNLFIERIKLESPADTPKELSGSNHATESDVRVVRQLQVKKSAHEKLGRARQVLKTMTQGVNTLRAMGKPGRVVDSKYAIREIVLKEPVSASSANKLESFWLNSGTTLDFSSWLKTVQTEHSLSGTTKSLGDWMSAKQYDAYEKQVWQSMHPQETFSPEKFNSWKQAQYDPNSKLADPKWRQESLWQQYNASLIPLGYPPISFETWQTLEVDRRKAYWQQVLSSPFSCFPHGTTLDDETFKLLDRKMQEHMKCASSEDVGIWVARELWKDTNPPDTSPTAFANHVNFQRFLSAQNAVQKEIDILQRDIDFLKNKLTTPDSGYRKEIQELLDNMQKQLDIKNKEKMPLTKASFETWLAKKEGDLRERWAATKMTIPFEQWKKQQVYDPLIPPSFVKLQPKDRRAYQANCIGGHLMRNSEPFSTKNESTVYNGIGWSIFVIGPQGDLHCASHITGVFHHSSFFSDGAVMAGGEIRTNSSGRILEISSKSGHYRPTQAENIAMLKWFKNNGTDLTQVIFTCFLPDGSLSSPMRAQDYLNGQEPQPRAHMPH